MALTLIEAKKKYEGDVVRSAVIELFPRSHPLLQFLPFETIGGNAYKYNQEGELPGVAFRGVNESYSEDAGVLNPQVEPLTIAGGDLDVDNFILQTQGEGVRATHEAMKVKALAHTIAHKFIKGDSATDPREPDGLQKRLTGNQLIAAGSASGGDALSLLKLDQTIDAVDGCTHLIMSQAMRRLLTAAARNTSVGGFISFDKDAFGEQISKYNGRPIIEADPNGALYASLGFNEANPGGGSAVGTSIYAVSFGDGKLTGLQSGDMDARDLGELETKPCKRTRVEWYVAWALLSGRAAARLYGIKNAAVVA